MPHDRCPETACVRHLLPSRIIAAAERRAAATGVGAERVLICADAITEEAYVSALAASIGTTYERFDRVSRSDCPLDDDQLIKSAAAGLLPLREGRGLTWIIAPFAMRARGLADPRCERPGSLTSFRLTSADRLRSFAIRHAGRTLGRHATDDLRLKQPLLSNAPRTPGRRIARCAAVVIWALAFFALAPLAMIEVLASVFCALFLAGALLRLLSCFARPSSGPHPGPHAAADDVALPPYTIICALYREASIVSQLVGAIRALDYPAEKLDVKFVLEADDHDTHEALLRLNLGPPFEIVIAPPIGPRTKPKALNIALPLARGIYTVVYDAEDKPEPDQLRRAIDAFRSGGKRLACVQASLTIDNTADNWLTATFTANYAGQFDVFLRGLAALHLPFPLGGSSNHFRTVALRKAGGWDPYNVTEDADLGIRLARLGYKTTSIPCSTYEEAPGRFVPWLKQRTRWYKGWMQTWCVHMRRPNRLLRELGVAGVITFQICFAANVIAALIHPFFMAGLAYTLYALPTPWANIVIQNAAPIFAASLLSGYASTIVVDLIGLRRRGLLRHAWVLALTPLYWLLLSLAAWRGLIQLIYDPQYWEKTEHGLAKTSRSAGNRQSPLDRRENSHGPTYLVSATAMDRSAPVAPVRIIRTAHAAMREGAT
ncbi:MAG TPA: glycosyltransferase family 2 protein [Xanthobacteraceae bacterium]|nr:glycosyltransferase family 2 protein [Xanthobacteraceae bacterium]